MARGRKKKIEQPVEPVEEVVQKVATKDRSTMVYTGTVKTGIVRDGKLGKMRTFHNEGRWPLFHFLDQCLAGNFTAVEATRPQFIQIFTAGDAGTQIPPVKEWTDFNNVFNSTNLRTLVPYPYMSAPAVFKIEDSVKDSYGSSSITYKFMIPFTQLGNRTSSDNLKNLNVIALYSRQYKDIVDQPSCFVFVTNGEENKLGSLIEGVLTGIATDKYPQYSLYIEWNLNINNGNNQQ